LEDPEAGFGAKLDFFFALKLEQVSSSQRKKGDSLLFPLIFFANLIQSPHLGLLKITSFGSKYIQSTHFCVISGIRSKSLPFIL